MTLLHTAARMALDALEKIYDAAPIDQTRYDLCKALRAALAAPMPEPVAWYLPSSDGDDSIFRDHRTVIACTGNKWEGFLPLYAAPPAAPASVVPAECCRNELLTALHSLASNYENALGMFGQDGEGRRKAEGDLAHAMKVAAKHNRNGPGCAAPVVREQQSREQQIAIREAHCNTASDEYFGARPQVDDATKRRIYEAGFKEGWESGIGGGGNSTTGETK